MTYVQWACRIGRNKFHLNRFSFAYGANAITFFFSEYFVNHFM